MALSYANLSMGNYKQNLLSDTFKELDYHFWYGFVLLTIFFSYVPAIRTR